MERFHSSTLVLWLTIGQDKHMVIFSRTQCYKLALTASIAMVAAIGFSALHAQAATLRVIAEEHSVAIGQPVRVSVALDANGDSINAIQAQLTFPAGAFKVQSISNGSSPISFWIDQPKEVTPGVIAFSGIVPGGFTGSSNALFSVILVPTGSGVRNFQIANATVLRNDGQGTAVTLIRTGDAIAVSNVAYSGPGIATSSKVLPEPFTPAVARDAGIFNNAYFVAFSTTDKGSGIDHYEVAEVSPGTSLDKVTTWRVAESPYELQDQTLASDIFVRAIDQSGNMRTELVKAAHAGISWMLITILIVLLGAGVWLWSRRRWSIRRRIR
jgi:hypothetical protein